MQKTLLLLSCVLGTACNSGEDAADILPGAYLLVVEDFVSVESLGEFCVSPMVWYSQEERHPEPVLEALEAQGYTFWPEGGLYPDTTTRILTLSPPIFDSLGLQITADLGEVYLSSGAVSWGGKSWHYYLDCSDGTCIIQNRSGPGHSDAFGGTESSLTQAVLTGEAVRCPNR